jgi:ribose transport system permease protein
MSVGMVASFGGLFAATMMKLGQPVPVAVLVGITVGLSSGLIAGLSVSRLRMNAFITTFALQQIYRGLIFIWTEGLPRPLMGPEYIPFTNIGQTKILNGSLQLPILIMLFIYILMALFMKYNRIGRSIYLIGNNAKAAHICGIRNKNIQLFMFMATGALAAVAGMLLAMRTGTSQPFVGEMYAMEAIAATIVGGTSMAGGKGNLGMTLVGVIIVYIIKNGLIMIGLDDFYQYIAVGLILFIAVLAQVQKTKR